MAELAARLGAHWGRHLQAAPEHWGIDWVVARDDESGAQVTALVAHVETGAPLKGETAVLVSAHVWATLRTLSERLRVPHIVVAEFTDTVLYRVWPPQSGIHYQTKLVEEFIVTSIQLQPESWQALP